MNHKGICRTAPATWGLLNITLPKGEQDNAELGTNTDANYTCTKHV